MGKGRNNEDGFVKLVPCGSLIQGTVTTNHKRNNSGRNSSDSWEKKYRELQDETSQIIRNLRKELEMANATIETMEESLNLADKLISDLQSDIAKLESRQPTCDGDDTDSDFSSGLGLSIGPDGDPKLYRLSDPDGELFQRRKFNGASVEIQPGKGFRIKAGWKRK